MIRMTGDRDSAPWRAVIADDDADIRILLLSASVDDASRRTATSVGADEFPVKPFSLLDLAARLAEISTGERVHQ